MGKSVLKEVVARKLKTVKRYVGYASTAAVVAFFVVPGPNMIVVVGGLVAGAVVAKVTRKRT